jgi:hypothetical protein
MIRQIASLLALLLLVSALVAYACLPSHALAAMLAKQFNQEELMQVAARGPAGALTALVVRNAINAALWIAIGAATAIVAYWDCGSGQSRKPCPKKCSLPMKPVGP